MPNTVHIHEDDLELYNGGRLEPERIRAVERHLSDRQTCRERLSQCVGVPLEAIEGSSSRESQRAGSNAYVRYRQPKQKRLRSEVYRPA
jgi:anti-sigma factor RsiW